MEVRNRKWDDDEFYKYLKEILALYPTGRQVDLDEALDYHRRMPEGKSFVKAHNQALAEGKTLVCPRMGVATIEGQIELYGYLEEAGADLLAQEVDTYTRRRRFDLVEAAVPKSIETGRSTLNGFPVVYHGVVGCRRVGESTSRPISARGGTGTPQLHMVIGLAGGATEIISGPFPFFFPCEPRAYLADVIPATQFIDRLAGWFEERGVPISVHYATAGQGTINEPSTNIVGTMIQMLLAAEQGVKNLSLSYCVNTCMMQDIAGLRVEKKLAETYLKRFGYEARIVQTLNAWMGPYPSDYSQALVVNCLDAATAGLGGAVQIMVKSTDEGRGLPSKESQAAAIRATKQVLYLLRNQRLPESKELQLEEELIETEVRLLMDSVLELGDGDVAIGTIRALEAGKLDFPYSINIHQAGKALVVRDNDGFVRFLDCGNLPFTREIVEFHREKVEKRKQTQNKKDYQMLIEDLSSLIPRLD